MPDDAVLGGEAGIGKGFAQMMSGVEVGRANVAARGVGVARRAYELGIRYAHERETFGKPLHRHQAIQFKLAEMATKIEAARLLTVQAARAKDAGRRADVETGMAKYFASEMCKEVVEESFRIHGGYGYSKEYEIERLYRDAPMLLIGEGTSEIQKTIIARGLLARLQGVTMGREIHARETRFGRYLEDFEVGDVYLHWPGKTITEADDHLFCMITMNHHPLHSDAHYAETETQFKRNVVVGNLVYSLALGMSVPDVSGKAIANLEIESLKHAMPTFHGDTIYAKTTVLYKTSRVEAGSRDRLRRDGRLEPARRGRVRVPPARAGSEAAAMIEDIDRRTLAIASAILVIVTTFGLLVIGPVGILAGPLVDRFGTQRLLARRNYKSPGAPLWSAAIGGVAMIPAIASGAEAADDRHVAVLSAVAAGVGADHPRRARAARSARQTQRNRHRPRVRGDRRRPRAQLPGELSLSHSALV